MTTTLLQRCSLVLVRTKFPGNLGAVARAMANFGLTDLRLVTPEADPLSGEARALASHGQHLLQTARQFNTLNEAVADTVWVACTSARTGGLFRKQNVLPVRTSMSLARHYAQQGSFALVFGPEDHGLTNEEITQCQHLLHIPAHPDYEVLNLAQAAVICLYEWFQASYDQPVPPAQDPLASVGDLARMFEHLEQALREVHFIWGEKGPSVFHALRHLLSRAQPTQIENKLLHGLARQLIWYVQHHPSEPPVEKLE